MALRCVAVFFACVALVVVAAATEKRVEIGKSDEENGESLSTVNGNGKKSGVRSAGNGIDGLLVGVKDISGLESIGDRRGAKRIYIPVTDNAANYLLNRSHASITRLRKVDPTLDFGPKQTFLEIAREIEDFPVKSIADPKSWIWDQLEQAYGFMNEIISEPSDIDEGRAKKKKKKILFFLIKLVVGLKVLLMGVLLPGVLTFTTVLSWKAVTLSILAFAFAKLGALKSMLKGFGESAEKAPSHHFVISPPSHWEKRSHHPPSHHHPNPPPDWHTDHLSFAGPPGDPSSPYRRSYPPAF